MIGALLKTLRPQQWVKNVFVAAPLVFAQKLGDPAYVARSAAAVFAFCLLSGAVYTFNDLRDLTQDRIHPTKRYRPIASGALSERTALIWAGILAAISLGGCALVAWQLAMYAGIYFVQNIAYSVRLKHIAFVDVALVAGGFLLRVLGGAAAIAVPPSPWLLACTALVALLFGLGKRAHELAWAERSGGGAATRAALAGYRLGAVRWAMLVLAVATVAAYVAYTVDSRTVREFGTDRLVYSAPLVALGVLRYLFLALWYPKEEPPTDAMLKDPWFVLDLVATAGTVVYLIYR